MEIVIIITLVGFAYFLYKQWSLVQEKRKIAKEGERQNKNPILAMAFDPYFTANASKEDVQFIESVCNKLDMPRHLIIDDIDNKIVGTFSLYFFAGLRSVAPTTHELQIGFMKFLSIFDEKKFQYSIIASKTNDRLLQVLEPYNKLEQGLVKAIDKLGRNAVFSFWNATDLSTIFRITQYMAFCNPSINDKKILIKEILGIEELKKMCLYELSAQFSIEHKDILGKEYNSYLTIEHLVKNFLDTIMDDAKYKTAIYGHRINIPFITIGITENELIEKILGMIGTPYRSLEFRAESVELIPFEEKDIIKIDGYPSGAGAPSREGYFIIARHLFYDVTGREDKGRIVEKIKQAAQLS